MSAYLIALTYAAVLSCEASAIERRASTLPQMDWLCFASFTIAFSATNAGSDSLGVDGDNFKKPRIGLKTVEGHTLKIVEYPSDPARRKEYGRVASEITEDFSRSNPVFAWRDDSTSELRLYAFNHADRLLSITRISYVRAPNLSSTQVLTCR
jgi:hypothetical protein